MARSGGKLETVKEQRDAAPRPRLLYLVKRWYAAVKARLDEISQRHGLTTGEYTMLSFLKRLEPCSAAELSREQRITPQAVTQQVAQLKAKNMVETRENEANRRISLISMTERGRTSLAAVQKEARRLEDQMMAELPSAQRTALLEFLVRATTVAENSKQGGVESDDE
jgi:DNA-binding MarR family transcriptional regulator